MLPSLLFLSLHTLSTGYLHCEQRFFRSALSPALLNVIWIATVFFLRNRVPSEAISLLSMGIVFGYCIQWIFTVGPSFHYLRHHLNKKEWLSPRLFSKEILPLFRSFSFSVIGIGAAQINTSLDVVFARFASLEGPAYLTYAIRPQQLPLALFSIAISSALLPALTRLSHSNDRQKFLTLFHTALYQVTSLIIPCTIGLLVLGAPIINLLFGRGAFTPEATWETTLCLFGYAGGLLPMSIAILLTPAFFAQKEYRIPAYGTLYSVGINLILNAFFIVVLGWGPAMLAVSTSLSAWVNVAYLWKRLSLSLPRDMGRHVATTLFWSLVSASFTLFVQHLYFDAPIWWSTLQEGPITFPRDFLSQLREMVALSLVFLIPHLPRMQRLQTTPNF